MIYYRTVSKFKKKRWTMIDGARSIRDGLVFIEQQMSQLQAERDAVGWEIGCKVPPYKTPQVRRHGALGERISYGKI